MSSTTEKKKTISFFLTCRKIKSLFFEGQENKKRVWPSAGFLLGRWRDWVKRGSQREEDEVFAERSFIFVCFRFPSDSPVNEWKEKILEILENALFFKTKTWLFCSGKKRPGDKKGRMLLPGFLRGKKREINSIQEVLIND